MPRRRTNGRRPAKSSKSRHRRSARAQPTLHYKVVELSNVDEASLEHTVNEWVAQGWQLDGVQFAMRESSKRPAMAFVFFTRAGPAVRELARGPQPEERFREEAAAHLHLRRVVLGAEGARQVTTDAWTRLAELADDGDAP